MSSVDLQKGLAQKLAQSGTPAKWVNCPNPLPSRVGATARCEVTFSDQNAVTALLTTTQVDGDKTTWEITEAQLTRDQVIKRVSALTGNRNVDCDSGMSGRVGSWVPCHVIKNGASMNQTAEVTEAKGLSVKVTVVEFLPSQQVEDNVKAKLTPLYGRVPDRVECNGDLPGIPGSMIQCIATLGDTADNWAVTVTSVADGNIEFDVARPAGRPTAGEVDMCPGCVG